MPSLISVRWRSERRFAILFIGSTIVRWRIRSFKGRTWRPMADRESRVPSNGSSKISMGTTRWRRRRSCVAAVQFRNGVLLLAVLTRKKTQQFSGSRFHGKKSTRPHPYSMKGRMVFVFFFHSKVWLTFRWNARNDGVFRRIRNGRKVQTRTAVPFRSVGSRNGSLRCPSISNIRKWTVDVGVSLLSVQPRSVGWLVMTRRTNGWLAEWWQHSNVIPDGRSLLIRRFGERTFLVKYNQL